MIEINLLPQEYRKKEPRIKGIDMSQLNLRELPIVPIAVAVAAVVLVLHAAFFGVALFGKTRLNELNKRYESLLPAKKESDALKARSAEESKRIGAIEELMVKRFSWARKMNALGETLTPGIWLSTLSYDERPVEQAVPATGKKPASKQVTTARSMVLTGYAAGAGEQGASLVGKFIKSMKSNADFYADFSDIVLGVIRSDKVEGQDVMQFTITCVFKQPGK